MPKKFLYLDTTVEGQTAKYLMALAPLNTSGDIYHIIAFIILLLHHDCEVPKILLTYDVDSSLDLSKQTETNLKTQDQSTRAYSLASALGCQQHFVPVVKLETDSGQPSVRQKALEKKLIEKNVVFYIDHRITTSLVTQHFVEYGTPETTRILRNGFHQRNQDFLGPTVISSVETYAKNCIETCTTDPKTKDKPKVILHIRYSSKSNKKQNCSDHYNQIAAFLKIKGYAIITVYADGRKRKTTLSNADLEFYPFQEKDNLCYLPNQEPFDTGKLKHLELFYQLQTTPHISGVIGGTSGTLDAAAFLGHRVLNIHDFGLSIAYQDYRLLLQMAFFAVIARTEFDILDTQTQTTPLALLKILNWLTTGGHQPKMENALKSPDLYRGGHISAHCSFDLLSSTKVLSKTSEDRGKWQRLTFFKPLQRELQKIWTAANTFKDETDVAQQGIAELTL